MKKSGVLNSDISRVLSYMRHTDTICISDCGLPCPDETELIDISLEKGVPDFVRVLKAVVNDMSVEKIFLAEEIRVKNPAVLKEIQTLLPGVRTDFMPHEEFKKKLLSCKAVVRSGEASPYANIILQSACIF
ncbi:MULTISPECIES: D-ribose pyranase [Treponema]|jgi:D-ribose pyranase|uniref:D-ribose pyranase n=1 Tax=Treponema socranskii subsp. socranskii VPI DR56BR1116 = ATCC 35536 TaxID=1125725 RepID=U2L1F5_TRESO|nr:MULTISPECIES: D-ribose pyranase [Treponema]ERF61000.1 transporter, RbsD/FucU family [Treponema socranskii subsp. socranskii VPI DR56BR1116 = ATCC 35536]ERJ98185.1 transporter, RbsD/FucU family [Treponema socranskii subsp. socranskii VPI DR56BR1116 = ATCC 35536]MBM7022551.1 D-ribose pyranase [Treponema sp. Marseille-Q4523]MDR9858648.1 D-ribose pyranase [Treponema socranskii]